MSASRVPLRLLTAACLVISGLVHLDLAHNYSEAPTRVLSQSTAFRLQAVVVLVLAAGVLFLTPRLRLLWLLVAVVAAGSLTALLISRYSTTTGLPGVYPEAVWSAGSRLGISEKPLAAIVEALASVLALTGLAPPARSRPRAGGRRLVSF